MSRLHRTKENLLQTFLRGDVWVKLTPLLWGIDGIWWSIVVAEAMAVFAGIFFLLLKRKKYHY